MVSLLYQNRELQCFDWTETNGWPTETVWLSAYFGIFYEIYGCFGLFRNSSVCFDCFDIGSKHRNKLKQTETNQNFKFFGFTKKNETKPKQILFRFVSVQTEIFFCFFWGYTKRAPTPPPPSHACSVYAFYVPEAYIMYFKCCCWFLNWKKERKKERIFRFLFILLTLYTLTDMTASSTCSSHCGVFLIFPRGKIYMYSSTSWGGVRVPHQRI